jgi:hypothetical protein
MEAHALILRRVGAALLVYFTLHLFTMVFDYAVDLSHWFAVDLLSLVLGLLLLQGSLAGARWAAFLTAGRLGATAIGVVALPLVLYWLPEARREIGFDLALFWGAVAVALNVGFDLWLLRELSDAPVEEALAQAGRGSVRRAALLGAALCIGVTLFAGTVFGLVYTAYRQRLPPRDAATAARVLRAPCVHSA